MNRTNTIAAFFLSSLFLFPQLSSAQDRDGADTASNWVTSHFEKYGIWTTACDERDEDGVLKKRCYIRYVDIFSEDPKFASVFMFVFQKDRKSAIQYSFESGTRYPDNGVRIEESGVTIWTASKDCLTGSGCEIHDPQEFEEALRAFQAGNNLVQEFVDRHGAEQSLKWKLDGFTEAYLDYLKQSHIRDLLN